MAETTAKYVTCPACHRLVTLTPKGKIRRHQAWVGAGIGCKAVGQTLAEARDSEVNPMTDFARLNYVMFGAEVAADELNESSLAVAATRGEVAAYLAMVVKTAEGPLPSKYPPAIWQWVQKARAS